MNTAQQHAFEQANLITQLVKYADRVILVESASAPERRAFVKLLADQLPGSIEILGLQASPHTMAAAIIPLVSDALQLSPGIESPRQLASAVHEAMDAQGRLLMVIENADAWIDTPQWSGLLASLRAAHDLAPNHLLFLLTGDIGLTDQLRLEPELSEMQSEIHLCQLLGEAEPGATPPRSTAADTANALKEEPLFADALEANRGFVPDQAAARRKSFSPMLLVAAGISVAIVTFGGFALLTSTSDKPMGPQILPLNSTSTQTTTPELAGTAPAQTDNPLPNDGGLGATSSLSGAVPAVTQSPPVDVPAAHDLAANPAPTPAALAPVIVPKSIEPPAAESHPIPRAVAIPSSAEKKLIAPREKPPVEKLPAEKPLALAAKRQEPAQPKATIIKGVDNAWYRARPKTRAAIQLGAFNDEKAALNFVKKHESSTRLGAWHVFSQKRNNQMLFTVTLGDFANVGDARKAASELSEALRQFKPYPRSFAAITDVLSQ